MTSDLHDAALAEYQALPLTEQARFLAMGLCPELPGRESCGLCKEIGRACLAHKTDAEWKKAFAAIPKPINPRGE
jgi:hypothetical protein